MALLSKSDLVYAYDWKASAGDNPKKTGSPDNDELNRKEGYEILDFINSFAAEHKLVNKETGTKIEKMIRDHLPGNLRSRVNVKKWLVDNWKSH
ncbi:hypothetical protein [Variovorax sp. YR566]|uniref:hypothetical protein n=1 Tax=Variovorax sp. YR566 TaxID=3450237 RepID=UPI003F7D588A